MSLDTMSTAVGGFDDFRAWQIELDDRPPMEAEVPRPRPHGSRHLTDQEAIDLSRNFRRHRRCDRES